MAGKLKNQVTLRLTTSELKTVKELQGRGLTVRQIFQHSNCPCEKCKYSSSAAYTDNGDEVMVPRGILKIK